MITQMKKHNVTNVELAKLAGISESAVSSYRTGKHLPEKRTAKIIADRFGISETDLLYGFKKQRAEPAAANPALAAMLKEAREAKGYSEYDVFNATGIDRRVLWLYENAKREPKKYHLIALAHIYDVPVEELEAANKATFCNACGLETDDLYSVDGIVMCADCMKQNAINRIILMNSEDVANMFEFGVIK